MTSFYGKGKVVKAAPLPTFTFPHGTKESEGNRRVSTDSPKMMNSVKFSHRNLEIKTVQ
jgi:hypothetical protein